MGKAPLLSPRKARTFTGHEGPEAAVGPSPAHPERRNRIFIETQTVVKDWYKNNLARFASKPLSNRYKNNLRYKNATLLIKTFCTHPAILQDPLVCIYTSTSHSQDHQTASQQRFWGVGGGEGAHLLSLSPEHAGREAAALSSPLGRPIFNIFFMFSLLWLKTKELPQNGKLHPAG